MTRKHTRLADFILSNVEEILVEWEEFARNLAPGPAMSVIALRDHAEGILRATARDMLSPQTPEQQADKSKGEGGGGAESDLLDSASEEHAFARVADGFNLVEVVSEYRALRASVLKLWQAAAHDPDEHDLQDLTRFNESIDQSLAEAVRSYTDRVEESRELFLATLGHDLRTPLNAMMLSAEVLAQSGQLDDEHTQIASRMASFGKTMTGMIHDLLDFTRTRLGAGMPLSVGPADLSALCQEVLDEFRATHPERSVRFESVGDLTGQWDAARLRQVLANLVANAIEHGEDGGAIEFRARSEGSKVALTVTNRGPVISSSALPTLFDPFVRAASTPGSNNGGGGVGLGLYIAREIVTAHAGTIAVASSEATGTMFTVRLPRQREKDAPASDV
ncbi:MAG TPA: sensor histidine kinase [Thermoanaerobaculia bacterium]|nr:sensor histidine kinase [Thermoanaerobaculia bacterium]